MLLYPTKRAFQTLVKGTERSLAACCLWRRQGSKLGQNLSSLFIQIIKRLTSIVGNSNIQICVHVTR